MLISMSRKTLNIVGVVILLIAAVAAAIVILNTEEKEKPQPSVAQSAYDVRDACKVLPLAAAKKVVGSDAKQSELENNPTAKSSSRVTTSCVYYNEKTQMTFTAVSSKTRNASSDSQSAFAAQVAGAEKIDGYGDAAFWAADSGALYILKGNTIYTLQGVNLDQAKQIANEVKGSL